MANISAIKLPDGITYDIADKVSGYITGMTILSYGSSTWADFLEAYNLKKVVYCRASSNSNPGTGSQTRLAFMAYVNNAETPTEVEFQYYRSVSSHSDSQQGDQVYVYKLNSSGTWSVITRNSFTKIAVDGDLTKSYSNGTLTLSVTLPDTSGFITTETDPIFSASPAAGISSSDITAWNGKQVALVSGTNIKTVNGTSLLGSGDIAIDRASFNPTYSDDLNSFDTTYPKVSIYYTDNNSLNTPYKAGLTGAQKGICLSFSVDGYWTQIFTPYADEKTFQRYGTPPSWKSDWQVLTSITYGTSDLTAGSSALATGQVYLVYE